VNLDYQKKLLSYHGRFDSMQFFTELDQDNDGYLTAKELNAYFEADEDFLDFNFENLVSYWGSDDKMSY